MAVNITYNTGDAPTISICDAECPWPLLPCLFQGEALRLHLAAHPNTTRVAFNITFNTGDALTVALDGTSMATPHVSATAARVWAAYPRCMASDIRQALRAGARSLGRNQTQGRNDEYGYGLVQVVGTLKALQAADCAQP